MHKIFNIIVPVVSGGVLFAVYRNYRKTGTTMNVESGSTKWRWWK